MLFGLAGAIKPQAMVLLPVALIALGAWRAMLVTALCAAAVAVASAIVFGVARLDRLVRRRARASRTG